MKTFFTHSTKLLAFILLNFLGHPLYIIGQTGSGPNPVEISNSIELTDNITSISITKDGIYEDTNKDGITNIGDNIIYNYVITNTGNVSLTNVKVTNINAVIVGEPITSLKAGASDTNTFKAIHAITQEEIDEGVVYDLATVAATPPKSFTIIENSTDPTPSLENFENPYCPDCTITTLKQTPSITITKKGIYEDTNKDGIINNGDNVVFNYVVTNNGNVTLKNLIVEDKDILISGNSIASLEVGVSDSSTFTASRAITQKEINASYINNLATSIVITSNKKNVRSTSIATSVSLNYQIISDNSNINNKTQELTTRVSETNRDFDQNNTTNDIYKIPENITNKFLANKNNNLTLKN